MSNKKLRFGRSLLLFIGIITGGVFAVFLIKLAVLAGYVTYPPMIFVS